MRPAGGGARHERVVAEPAPHLRTLCTCGEILRLRIVLRDFGLVWQGATDDERSALVDTEPELFDPDWDAFLAAYIAHLCDQDSIEPPAWVLDESRFLPSFWFAGGCFPFDRQRTLFTTPAAFRARGVWLPAEELLVV